MSEEKKEDSSFLSGHAELLNSIKKPEDTPEASEETQPAEETATEEAAAPAEEIAPVEDTAPEEEPTEEADSAEEEPEALEEPALEEELPTEEPAEEEVTEQHVVAEVPPVVEDVPVKEPKPKKKPGTPAEAKKQKHDALEQAEVKEVLNFINKYVKPAAILVVGVCIVILGFKLMENNKVQKAAEADTALSEATTAAEYQAVLDAYGSTPSAPLAMLGLAQEKFNSGDVAGAEGLYADFLGKYSDHAMALQVEFNRIKCMEAMGQLNEAATQYQNFKANHENSHLAPFALLGAARCKETAGDLAGAKQSYEDVIGLYPNTTCSQMAEANLTILNAKVK